MQAYSNPQRESNPHALPDIEVFYMSANEIRVCSWFDDDGNDLESGYYWQSCFPGCIPDSEPMGPFATKEEALADAQDYE